MPTARSCAKGPSVIKATAPILRAYVRFLLLRLCPLRPNHVEELSDAPIQRGGAGNIESPGLKPKHHGAGDTDVVPETAIKPGERYENYHVGRGGEGNIHKEKATGHEHESLKDRAKHLLGGEKKEGS